MVKRTLLGLAGCALFFFNTGCATEHTQPETVEVAQSALTNVTWMDVVGATASGNSLTKTGATGWNAGGASNETLAADGYAQFTTAENTTAKMAGLSKIDAAQTFANIDFAFYLSAGGAVAIYEDGTYKGSFGTYVAGDVFKVQTTGHQVTYLQNGATIYTSSQASTSPLLFDAVLYTPGATVNSAVLNDTAASGFWQSTSGVTTSATGLVKTAVDGWSAGGYTTQSLSGDGSVSFSSAEANTDKLAGLTHVVTDFGYTDIDFGIYLTGGGVVGIFEDGAYVASGGTYVANDVFTIQLTGTQVTYLKGATVLYTSTATPTLPLVFDASLWTTGTTINGVTFTSTPYWQNATGVTTSGHAITKTGATGWTAGASTTATVATDGYVQFSTAEANTAKMAGLSNGDSNQSYTDIDFAFYLSSAGSVAVYEAGTFVGTFGTYVANDVFKVQSVGGQVSYLQNGTQLYTSTKTPTSPLLLDTSLYTTGATLNNVVVAPISSAFWQNLGGVTPSGTGLTKTGTTGWTSGGSTIHTISGDGYAQFSTAEATTSKMAGLSHTDPDQGYTSINYAFFLTDAGSVAVYESGAYLGIFGTYVAGDTFKIQVTGSVVTYLQNGNLLYTSTATPSFPLLLDTSLYSAGATIQSAVLSP